jgi:hypothetical protein
MRRVDPVIIDEKKKLREVIAAINGPMADTYTVATRPTGVAPGTVIFVSDAAAGANFQGWSGSAWINLG